MVEVLRGVPSSKGLRKSGVSAGTRTPGVKPRLTMEESSGLRGGGGVAATKSMTSHQDPAHSVPFGVAEQVQSGHGSMSRVGVEGGSACGSGLRAEIFISCF